MMCVCVLHICRCIYMGSKLVYIKWDEIYDTIYRFYAQLHLKACKTNIWLFTQKTMFFKEKKKIIHKNDKSLSRQQRMNIIDWNYILFYL